MSKVLIRKHIAASIDAMTLADAHVSRLMEMLKGAGTNFEGSKRKWQDATLELAVELGRLDRILARVNEDDD